MQILTLTNGGLPVSWVSQNTAAALVYREMVTWGLGETKTFRGGYNKSGVQSSLEIPSIIAVRGARVSNRVQPLLTNRMLFKRDNYCCLYCGEMFPEKVLTRDHVIPKGQGGADTWMNVVAACKSCNNVKGCRTPEQANMPLLAVPFVPNPFEVMYLSAKRIQKEQTEYLMSRFAKLAHVEQ